MSAYVIGHITVKDAAKWAEYRERVPATLAPWGAKVVFRGRLVTVFSGEHDHTDTVVIQFPDQESIQGWHGSAAYQEIIPLRTEAAKMVLISFDE